MSKSSTSKSNSSKVHSMSEVESHNGDDHLPYQTNDWKMWLKNRYVMTFISLSFIVVGTCTYYGWQHMRYILVEEDKFIWTCADDPTQTPAYDDYACDAQAKAISTSFTIASSCEYGGAILAGIAYDHLGPRYTALIGVFGHLISWGMIIPGNNTTMMYFGFAIQGLAVNMGAFPAFILADLFPGHEFLMEAANLALQCTSPIINPIVYTVMMQTGWSWFRTMFGLLVVVLVFGILYVIIMPSSHASLAKDLKERGLKAPVIVKSDLRRLFKYFITVEYVAFSIWYVLMIMQYSMYSASIDVLASREIASYIGWIFWLQGPFGICWGLLNDKFLNLPIVIALTSLQLISFTTALINAQIVENGSTNEVLFYISATLYVISNAYIFTSKYTFVTELFPRTHFGKLAGLIGFLSGVLQNFNILVINSELSSVAVLWIYLSFSIPQALLIGFICYRIWYCKVSYLDKVSESEILETSSMEVKKVQNSDDSDSSSYAVVVQNVQNSDDSDSSSYAVVVHVADVERI